MVVESLGLSGIESSFRHARLHGEEAHQHVDVDVLPLRGGEARPEEREPDREAGDEPLDAADEIERAPLLEPVEEVLVIVDAFSREELRRMQVVTVDRLFDEGTPIASMPTGKADSLATTAQAQ